MNQERIGGDSPDGVPRRPLFDAFGVTLLSQVNEFPGGSSGANDVWGYVSPQGNEYAVVGLFNGTAFVNVTDPGTPVIVAEIPDAASLWSDMATYQQYAYNVNESGGGMQIIDLSLIDQGIVTLLGALTDAGLQTAHNVFVNPDSGYAYLCGANAPSFGLVAVELSDPANPAIVGIWEEAYVHDVYATNYDDCPYSGRSGPCEIAFAFCGGAGFKIIDVTDKTAMTTIKTILYPNLAYCHQGWLTEDKSHILLGDEADETSFGLTTTTVVINVVDLDAAHYVTSFSNGETSIDHNLMIRGNYVFEANYTTGLRIYDISDVNSAAEVGFFDTFPGSDAPFFDGAWGVYSDLPSGIVLISDLSGGLFVLDVFDAVGCQADSHCDDDNPCTTDTCNASGDCANNLVPEGTFCDDGNVCTFDGQCDAAGNCISTDINTLPCSDDAPCFPGTCDLQAGMCVCFPCTIVTEPFQEAGVVETNRYLSFTGANPGQLTALRVTFADLPAPFEEHIGESMWVGEPQEYCENSGQSTPPPEGCGPAPGLADTFKAAQLECDPVFLDWDAVGQVHVLGEEVVPGGEYVIQAIAMGCYSAGIPSYSTPLSVTTSIWGDLVSDCTTDPCGPPDGTVNVITDCVAVLDKFVNAVGAPIKTRMDIAPDMPDYEITITDIVKCIGAFTGDQYPFTWPAGCP